jgi:hypothetical protein
MLYYIVAHSKKINNVRVKPRLAKCAITTENISLDMGTYKTYYSNEECLIGYGNIPNVYRIATSRKPTFLLKI